ncbi:hypothetical protein MPTA5024_32190 [Microbispora sp. ATCC PTA-5024]|nr:hypothetical protein MPTA5024_32190 [Microbispora sp. ATCC PTA-5024]
MIAAGPSALTHIPPPPRPAWTPHAGGNTATTARDAAGRTLIVTVSRGEQPRPAQRFALLTCDPVTGTHPSAVEACQTLEKVQGDPARLKADPNLVCPLIWDPVTVTANGIWDGRYVWYQRTFASSCEKRSVGDGVFDI